MKKLALVASALLALNISAASAETNSGPQELFFNLGMGITFGGEKLATVTYVGGDDEDVRAGGFYQFWAGVGYEPNSANYALETRVGYHADSTSASNGEITFDRITLDILGFFKSNQHRFGGGLTYHLSPELDIEFGGNAVLDFDNALGAVIEYQYATTQNARFGVRGVLIDYAPSALNGIPVTGDDVNGNHVGGFFMFSF